MQNCWTLNFFFFFFFMRDLLGGVVGGGALLVVLVHCTCYDLVGGDRRGRSNEGASFSPH